MKIMRYLGAGLTDFILKRQKIIGPCGLLLRKNTVSPRIFWTNEKMASKKITSPKYLMIFDKMKRPVDRVGNSQCLIEGVMRGGNNCWDY
jgi:hypothetical protein